MSTSSSASDPTRQSRAMPRSLWIAQILLAAIHVVPRWARVKAR